MIDNNMHCIKDIAIINFINSQQRNWCCRFKEISEKAERF
jgi:hypothetical protein